MELLSKLSLNIFKKLQNFLFPKTVLAEKVLQVDTRINYYLPRFKKSNRPNPLLSQETTNKTLTQWQKPIYFNYRSYSTNNKFDFKPKVDRGKFKLRQTTVLQPNTFREIDALNESLRYDVRQELVNKNYQENVIQVPLNTLETVELLHWEISSRSTELVNLPPVQCDTGKGGCDDKLPECEIENEIKRPPCPPKPPNTRVCPKDLLIKKKKNIKPNEKT